MPRPPTIRRIGADQRHAFMSALASFGLLVLLGLFFLWQRDLMTWPLWAYNVERAGRLLDEILVWPDPRRSDAFPTVAPQGAEKGDAVLAHLAAAIRWRPTHPHAYRLAGYLYAARDAWLQAADSFQQAALLAPEHPLYAWEAGLAYERMAEAVEQAPREPLLDAFADGWIEAPSASSLQTPFCELGSCAVGRTRWMLPWAEIPGSLPEVTEVLFTHPPLIIRQQIDLPSRETALFFRLGLAPEARGYGTDGATFRIWVEDADERLLVFERTLDAETARRGWVAGQADLSLWRGRRVTLLLDVDGGPAGDTTGDWYGWGDLFLTTPTIAAYARRAPHAQMRRLWLESGFGPEPLFQRGLDALVRGQRPSEARRWFRRVIMLDPTWPNGYSGMADAFAAEEMWAAAQSYYLEAVGRAPDVRDHLYNAARMAMKLRNWEEAVALLERAPNAPRGVVPRSLILYEAGRIYQHRLRDLPRAWHAYQRALDWNEWGTRRDLLAQTHFERGQMLLQDGDAANAVREYRVAREINPAHLGALLGEARALHRLEESEMALTLLEEAAAAWPERPEPLVVQGDILRDRGRLDEARAAYEEALSRDPENRAARQGLQALEHEQP